METERETAARALKRLHSIEKIVLTRLQFAEKASLVQCLADEEHALMQGKGCEAWLTWWKDMLKNLHAGMREKDVKLRRLEELNADYTNWIAKRLRYYDVLLLEKKRKKLENNNDYTLLIRLCSDFNLLWEGLLKEFGIVAHD